MALLLLPPPPNPPSASAVQVAFHPPLRSTIHKLSPSPASSSLSSSPIAIDLDIALPCPPFILSTTKLPSLLSHLYALLDTLLTESSSTLVKPRLLLLSYPPNIDYYTPLQTKLVPSSPSCLIDLSVLALSNRPWTRVFAVDGESGERLHRQFMSVVNSRFSARVGGTWKTERVRGGLSMSVKSNNTSTSIPVLEGEEKVGRRKRIVVAGGLVPMTVRRKLEVTTALVLGEFGGHNQVDGAWVEWREDEGVELGDGEEVEGGLTELVSFLRATVGINPVTMRMREGVLVVEPFGVVCVQDPGDLERYLSEGDVVVVGGDEKVKKVVEEVKSRRGDSISLFEVNEATD